MSRSGSLPVELLCRINSRCDEFESACQNGSVANLDTFLDGFTGIDRGHLLRHLIPIDIEYREQRGQIADVNEYLHRFPELDSTWLSAGIEADDPAALTAFGSPKTGISPSDGECTAEVALQRLVDSQLLSVDKAASLRSNLAATASDLTARLVAEGKLTPFQARRICAMTFRPLLIGGYLLLDRIGAGGMGTVYKALHRRMNREVALKLLKSTDSADHGRRFQREAEAAAKLIHPNIVTAFDAGEDQGVAYLVTEFIPGIDLSAKVRRDGPLPLPTAINYIIQAARGLAYAHSQGIIHRDVKPSNLLVDQHGKVQVLDVGLARLTRGQSSESQYGQPPSAEHSSLGALIGTVDYMAPEQASAPTKVNERVDIYGLGCTLHYLLTGKPLYPGKDVWAKLAAHRDEPVPSLSKVRPEVPTRLNRLFQSMVAKRPEDRPTSMGDVARLLKRAGQPRRTTLLSALAAMIIGAIGFGIWWMNRPSSPPAIASHLAAVPFDGAKYQQEWAERLGLPIESEDRFGIKFMLVPPGQFRRDGGPLLTVDRPFYLSRTEVTVGQMRQYVRSSGRSTHVETNRRQPAWGLERTGWYIRTGAGYNWSNVGLLHPLTDDHPAYNICWQDVVEMAAWMSENSENTQRYRPPTHNEWEFACAAGSDGPWCCGNDRIQLIDYAWFRDNYEDRKFRPVGLKRPNAFGLFDMHGSMNEWCDDDGVPQLCGGNFNSTADAIRSSAQTNVAPTRPSGGIRLLREISPQPLRTR